MFQTICKLNKFFFIFNHSHILNDKRATNKRTNNKQQKKSQICSKYSIFDVLIRIGNNDYNDDDDDDDEPKLLAMHVCFHVGNIVYLIYIFGSIQMNAKKKQTINGRHTQNENR